MEGDWGSKGSLPLRQMTTVPFAIGEEFSSKWAFAPYIGRGHIYDWPNMHAYLNRVRAWLAETL
jgi:hypothetical protein